MSSLLNWTLAEWNNPAPCTLNAAQSQPSSSQIKFAKWLTVLGYNIMFTISGLQYQVTTLCLPYQKYDIRLQHHMYEDCNIRLQHYVYHIRITIFGYKLCLPYQDYNIRLQHYVYHIRITILGNNIKFAISGLQY